LQFEQQLRKLKKLGDPIEMRVQVMQYCTPNVVVFDSDFDCGLKLCGTITSATTTNTIM
jgi:hypothetical protein